MHLRVVDQHMVVRSNAFYPFFLPAVCALVMVEQGVGVLVFEVGKVSSLSSDGAV
jgi:hypothetical protein